MELRAKDIAAFLNGEVVGDGEIKVSGVSKIEEGKKGTLAFLANPKYENYLYSTNASIVLINKNLNLQKEVKTTLIKVENAYQSFASLLELYLQAKANLKIGIEQPSFIDQTVQIPKDIYVGVFAYVGKNVKLGENVKIYPQVYIGDNVSIGDNTILYAGVKIYDDTVIGKSCICHSGVVIGSDGFGFAQQKNGEYKKIAQIGNVIIEDNVEIGANATIDCGTMESTIIRKGTKIDNMVQIAHNCEIGENTVIAAQAGLAGTTKIGRNCRIGGQSGFAGHLKVGENSQIAARSGIMKDVKEGSILFGLPALEIKRAFRVIAALHNLPELRNEFLELKKEVKQIQNKNSI